MKKKQVLVILSAAALSLVILLLVLIFPTNKPDYEKFIDDSFEDDLIVENSIEGFESDHWDDVVLFAELNDIKGEPTYYDTLSLDNDADEALGDGYNECYIFYYWGEVNVVVIENGVPIVYKSYTE